MAKDRSDSDSTGPAADRPVAGGPAPVADGTAAGGPAPPQVVSKAAYEKELARLQTELVRTERERSQWYFQRYIAHLPAAGEIVLFDRSWYNRAGVEKVMDFCTEEEHAEFFRTCPQIERALVRSGIILVKYWLSLSDEEQERRFTERINNPGKRWKLSPMDLEARARWVDYAEAKDEMFAYTDIKEAPWYVVDADDKKAARLNIISHLLEIVPYEAVPHETVELPPRQQRAYERPPIDSQTWVPNRYVVR